MHSDAGNPAVLSVHMSVIAHTCVEAAEERFDVCVDDQRVHELVMILLKAYHQLVTLDLFGRKPGRKLRLIPYAITLLQMLLETCIRLVIDQAPVTSLCCISVLPRKPADLEALLAHEPLEVRDAIEMLAVQE